MFKVLVFLDGGRTREFRVRQPDHFSAIERARVLLGRCRAAVLGFKAAPCRGGRKAYLKTGFAQEIVV